MFHLREAGPLAVAFIAITLGGAAAARADIILATGNNPQIDENVLLSTGLTDNPIFGTTNASGLSVRFSSDEDLTAPSSGQARIEAADGTLTFLAIDIPGWTFTSLILNVDAAANGSIDFVVTENNAQQTAGTFSLSGNGSNFFTITAINGQRISSASFTTNINTILTNVDDVSQIRIGGAAPTTTPPIPEPATMLLFGTGLAGGVVRRWRQRRR